MSSLEPLNPDTFAAFMERVNADAELKADIISGIGAIGFVAVLEQYFELTERQQALLEGLKTGRGAARHWEQLITLALNSRGEISLVHGGDSFDLELQASIPFAGEIDLSIHCG